MNKCKRCGKPEWGYASLLNREGLCYDCVQKDIVEKGLNVDFVSREKELEEKVRDLQQELQLRIEDNSKQHVTICNLQKQLDDAVDALYQYIQIYGVEKKCSKYLERWCSK